MTTPEISRGPQRPVHNDCTPKTASAHPPATGATVPERPDLKRWTTPELAEGANREHGLCTDLSGKAMEHAIRCGDYLNEVKGRLKHGEWGPWLKANFKGTGRHARRYTFVARNTRSNRTRVSDLSLRRGLAELGSPVEPPKPSSPVGGATADDGSEDLVPNPQEEGARNTETAEVPGGLRAEHGSDLAATADPAQAVGVRGSLDAREKSVEAGTVFVRGGSLPEEGVLVRLLGEGKPAAMTCDVSGTRSGELDEAKAFLDEATLAAKARSKEVHLLVACLPDPGSREAVAKAIRRTTSPKPGRRSASPKQRDRVANALKLLPTIVRRSSDRPVWNDPITIGDTVSRDAPDRGERLVIRRDNLRLSIPATAETVAGLTKPIIVPYLDKVYKTGKSKDAATFASSFKKGDAKGTLRIRSGSRSFEFRGLDQTNVPNYERAPKANAQGGGFGYEAGPLARALRRVIPYASTDEQRPFLRAVMFEKHGGGTRLLATDSFRMIKDDSLTAAVPTEDVLLPVRDLALLSRILQKADPEARVGFDIVGHDVVISGVLVDGTAYEIASRPEPGNFPRNCQELVPKEDDLARFGLPVGEATEAVEAALALAGKEPKPRVCMEFAQRRVGTPASATISIEAEAGSYSETISADVTEDASVRKACFNVAFLLNALETFAGDETVPLGINRAKHEGGDWTLKPVTIGDDVLLMPMRPPGA